MRTGAVLGGSMLLLALGGSAAEARRDTALFLVGASVPAPGCVATVAAGGQPAVSCSGAVPFVVRTTPLPSGAAAAEDAFQVTVTY